MTYGFQDHKFPGQEFTKVILEATFLNPQSESESKMSDENVLVSLDDLGLAPAKYVDDTTFGMVATASSFLPRLQLCSGNSEVCKMGLIPMGRWGLLRAKDDVEDLTNECPFLALDWRAKALDMSDKDTVISVFDAKSEAFKKIVQKSEIKDSGCMFGAEFLVWCPTSRTPCFATLYMGSKTARREAANVRVLIGKPGLLKLQTIKNKKHTWHGPVVVPYSGTFAPPDMEELKVQIDAFRNPAESEVEKAPEAAATRDR